MKIRDLSEVLELTSAYYFAADNGNVNRKVSFGTIKSILFGSGLSVTGALYADEYFSKFTDYERGTPPSSNLYKGHFFVDNVGTRLGTIEVGEITDGTAEMHVYLSTPNGSTDHAQSGIVLKKTAAGVLACSIAGATDISGMLTSNGHIMRKISGYTMGTAPASRLWGTIGFVDSAGSAISYVQSQLEPDGSSNLRMVIEKPAAGGGSASGLVLKKASGGTLTCEIAGATVISGNLTATGVYSSTSGSAANVVVGSDGSLKRSTASSRRYKHSIRPLTGWRKVLDIPVVSFVYNDDYVPAEDQRYHKAIPGFIAEDVEEAYPIAAEKPDGIVEDWNIRCIVPPMLAVEQDHERRIAELEAEIAKLKGVTE